MSVSRDQLLSYLDEQLLPNMYKDYCPNGLQVEGGFKVKTICTAVSASQDTIEEAVRRNADVLLVHHGFFWKGESPIVTGMKRQRLMTLLSNDVNLIAYHLPLDGHITLGNNIGLGRALSIADIQSLEAMGQPNLLWHGKLQQPLLPADFAQQISDVLERKPQCIRANDKPITSVAWCTGGAQDLIIDAHALGVDAFISGEVSERTFYQAKELGIHYYAAGHHATERFGVQQLGHHLQKHFDITHHFIDSFNPI